jgi:hypothetical protein
MTYVSQKQLEVLTKALGSMPISDQLFNLHRSCCCCGSRRKIHKHHVTYNPDRKVNLCAKCHRLITMINTVGAIATGTKLDNNVRTVLWDWFVRTNTQKNVKFSINTVLVALGIKHCFSENDRLFIKKAGELIYT